MSVNMSESSCYSRLTIEFSDAVTDEDWLDMSKFRNVADIDIIGIGVLYIGFFGYIDIVSVTTKISAVFDFKSIIHSYIHT